MDKPSAHLRSPFLIAALISLAAGVGFALLPVQVLTVRIVPDNTLLYCSPIATADEFILQSVNSIFQAPVQDYLRVMADRTLEPVQVMSTPAVLNYLGIPDYTLLSGTEPYGRGIPSPARFREIHLKVDGRGQQHLLINGQDLSLYQLVPDATVLVITIAAPPRIAACR